MAYRAWAAGYEVQVPFLLQVSVDGGPFWLRVVSGVCHELRQMPADRPVALVPHSKLGLFIPTGGPTVVTDDPRSEARRRADRIREQTGVELTVEEILDSPHVFIGSIKDLARKFADLRERFGISSFLIDDLDALAPVVEELAGQ